MTSRRTFITRALGTAALASTGTAALVSAAATSTSTSAASGTGASHIAGATAITAVFGDGQKLIAVALEYDKDIATSALSTTTFRVGGRTVTGVYATARLSPAQLERGPSGRYVIVELSPDDAGAALTQNAARMGPPGGPGQGGPPSGGPTQAAKKAAKKAAASVTQVGTVTATDGSRYAASAAAIATTRVLNLIVDEFAQLAYKDPKTGQTLAYNLFIPRGYDKRKSYPLVLFMHDASVLSTVTTTTLTQGLGAVCWASPADQAARPAFVLAPQYSSVVVDDNNGQHTVTKWVETTVDLVDALTRQYNIDKKRLYTTGQSMGAMMSIVMDIAYPDLFAASYIVAGQWDPTKVGPMATDKLWIVVSQGDDKAYPGENAITAALEKKGARVSRAVWDGRSGAAQFAAGVKAMVAKGTPVNYAALEKGTVVPSGQTDSSGANHTNTWRIAYTIEGIRAWIFQQHK